MSEPTALAPGTSPTSPWEPWQRRLLAAEQLRKDVSERFQWQTSVKRYAGLTRGTLVTLTDGDLDIQVNKDFSNVEQKGPLLFFQSPDLIPEATQPGLDDAVTIFGAVINKKMADLNVLASIHEVIFDVLCPSGLGAVKIGYEAVTSGMVDVPTNRIDPLTNAPAIDPATGKPETKPVPNVVYQRQFQSRISPTKMLLPDDFEGSDYDTSAWIGMEYDEPLLDGDAKEASAEAENPDRSLNPLRTGSSSGRAAKAVRYEVWFRPARCPLPEGIPIVDMDGQPLSEAAMLNPETIARLRFTKGTTLPSHPPDCPYQRHDARGRIEGGITGYPIRPVALRYMADSAWAFSDCWAARKVTDELSRSRSLMLQHRNRSLPMVGYDATSVLPADLEKIKMGKTGALVGFNGPLKDSVWPITHGEHPRENFTFNEVLNDDIVDLWALRNATDFNTKTATEATYQQGSTDARMDAQRAILLRWHVANVEKVLAPLVQLFADEDEYVRLEGDDAKRLGPLVQWNKQVVGSARFSWTAKPDSQIRVDAASDRKQALDFINYTIKSPYINQEFAMEWLARKFGVDPKKVMAQPQPPPPEKPNIAYAIKMEDFAGPAAAVAALLVKAAGIDIPADVLASVQTLGAVYAAQQAALEQAQASIEGQPQHGGPADKADLLNKRQSDQTGGVPNSGAVLQ